MSAERRVGRDDDDAASRWSLAPRRGLLEQATDRDSVNPQLLRGAEVRQREHADRRAADDTARGADPALPAEADHARAGAHGPFFDVLACLAESTADVFGVHLDGTGVVEPPVVALADNRNHEVLGSDRRIRRDRGGDGAVVDASDRHRRRQIHGVSMQPHSAIWIEPVSSPAPLRTAVPARIGVRTSPSRLPGTIAVTPVRATPRPPGGSGSSRRTVTCPTVTPSTSVIEFRGPASNSPIRSPWSRSRSAAMPGPYRGSGLESGQCVRPRAANLSRGTFEFVKPR